mmetsp:Transcript_28493/g.82432  ORF Transcript_28493/g.82432 Transcript_28493/m.82432 type:complete len:86 (-) Transcript_28493:1793-2050(-)
MSMFPGMKTRRRSSYEPRTTVPVASTKGDMFVPCAGKGLGGAINKSLAGALSVTVAMPPGDVKQHQQQLNIDSTLDTMTNVGHCY